MRRLIVLAILPLALFVAACSSDDSTDELILATTTSTQDSGLLDVLVPAFEKECGCTVKTVAVGSGQAIEQASRGDADVVLAHSPKAEEDMMARGDGIERTLIMHNDFILVGPANDPAGVRAASGATDALRRIAEKQSDFVSRGDQSGTHALELKLWDALGSRPAGQSWYAESGQGMGATLQIASQKSAYTISDRATYLAQKEHLDLEILNEGDDILLNIYHAIVVNPERHGNVNAEEARAFVAFLTREDVQKTIGDFGAEKFGQSLFVPDAGKAEAGN